MSGASEWSANGQTRWASNQMVRKPDGGKPSRSRTRELLHRRLKQRCSGGGTPKQPTHHVPFCFEEYVYTIQGVRRVEAMGRSQMPPLSLWLKGSETEPNAKSVPTSSHRNSFTHLCDHDQGKSCYLIPPGYVHVSGHDSSLLNTAVFCTGR